MSKVKTAPMQPNASALKHLSRLATLGTLAAGVAHEINAPLASIDLIALHMKDLLESKKVDLKEILEIMDRLLANVGRAKKIGSGFRDLARDTEGDPFTCVRVKDLIEGALNVCEFRFKEENVKLIKGRLNPSLWINCRAVEVEQVLMNLLGNACDAIQKSKKKWIRIGLYSQRSRGQGQKGQKGQGQKAKQNSTIEIRITDCGRGIPKRILERIFDPFFTTKNAGQGVGLGLSVSKDIVENHSGKIRVNPKSPYTSFSLIFPSAR